MKKQSRKIPETTYAIKVVLLVFVFSILSSCEKDTDFILQNEWKVKSIVINNQSLKPPSPTLREEAYILKFINDSIFHLASSTNYAGGGYEIISGHEIIILAYSNFTEAGGETYFDELLYDMFNDIDTYFCKNNKLTFLAGKNRIILEKQ